MAAPLLAVDGPSLLHRAFHALPDSIGGPNGPANALLGSTNVILAFVLEHEPRAVVVCFGLEAAKYRVDLFPPYHAQRPELPESLDSQFRRAPDFYASLGWTVSDHDGLEADDLLGSYAEAERRSGGSALILTGDRDMFQCVSDDVTVLYLRTGVKGAEQIDETEVRRRYGVPPSLVPDFIALRGDPSDGLPGGRGIGEKTAAELLRNHGSLEAALDAWSRVRPPRVAAALRDQREELEAFKRIATLQDVAVGRPPDRPTDFAHGALTARENGLNRLAERLESLASG